MWFIFFVVFLSVWGKIPDHIIEKPWNNADMRPQFYAKGPNCKHFQCKPPLVCMGMFHAEMKFSFPEFCELPEKACVIGSILPCPPIEKGNFFMNFWKNLVFRAKMSFVSATTTTTMSTALYFSSPIDMPGLSYTRFASNLCPSNGMSREK